MTDLLLDGLNVVFCGTAKGAASARTGAYYAHKGNKFWRILFDARFVNCVISPDNYRDLLGYGYGLTDLNKHDSGMDRSLSMANCDVPGFRSKIAEFKPRFVAFVGKRAAKIYLGRREVTFGEQVETIGVTRIFVLPSTSGAASGHWDDRYWFELSKVSHPAAGSG